MRSIFQALAEQRQRDAAHSAWLYSDERVAAAGAEHVTSWTSVARIERRKNDPAKAKKELAVDARRKRVRRIALDREDRDALRDYLCSLSRLRRTLRANASRYA